VGFVTKIQKGMGETKRGFHAYAGGTMLHAHTCMLHMVELSRHCYFATILNLYIQVKVTVKAII